MVQARELLDPAQAPLTGRSPYISMAIGLSAYVRLLEPNRLYALEMDCVCTHYLGIATRALLSFGLVAQQSHKRSSMLWSRLGIQYLEENWGVLHVSLTDEEEKEIAKIVGRISGERGPASAKEQSFVGTRDPKTALV
ncbi:hypothetical protein GGR57DRAFT_518007 [Xylariaceae sp. FL1272]|nr:hypothetical protein GGR57DRAFT_518007 [Xylariaceae sp. FL1272]